jgi:hypothetical protein
MYGTFELPHVLELQVKKARVEIEHFVPSRNVAYRRDQTTLGQTATVTGEIRESSISDVYTRIEQLRRLNDGVARLLDLEDGETPTFNAKLIDPEYQLNVETWIDGDYRVPYSLSLLEVE